jgi:predicted dehydrogenase
MSFLIVGGGKMGMSHLALMTQYVGKANLALCDSKRSTRLLFRYLGYRTFASVDEAAAKLERLQGVLIATPTASHAPLAHWAINRKVPFFVEKPLTLHAGRSAELATLADSAGIPAQVGFVLRYVATFQRLQELVLVGSLGRPTKYTGSMRGNVVTKPLAAKNWQGDFSHGGGCLNEYGPHLIDLCRFIFGSIATVDAAEMEHVHSKHADDRINAEWTHRDSTRGRLEIDWCDPTKRKSMIEFQIDFEYAEVRADNSSLEIKWRDSAPASPDARRLIEAPVLPRNVDFYLRGEEFSLQLEEFLTKCEARRVDRAADESSGQAATLMDGCEVDQLIDAIARKAGLK